MTCILVTGAAGRIGRAVVTDLLSRDYEVVGLDRVAAAPVQGRPAIRFVTAQADDVVAVREAVAGCDAVVHLAAIPAPTLADPVTVFSGNTQATMTVLTAAAEAGLRAAAIASSISVLGLVYANRELSPAYVPIDEAVPLQVTDAYALSKQCDEATAIMVNRRFGLPVAALRFAFTGSAEEIEARAASVRRDPAEAHRELWAYVDVRDAARACALAIEAQLRGELTGYVCCNVVAPDSLTDEPLAGLVSRYHPSTQIRAAGGVLRWTYDPAAARQAFGFEARYCRDPSRS